MGRPTAERSSLLTQKLIEVASQLMLQYGYDGTSLDLIASKAGVTKRTIYAKFSSKEKLLEQILLRASLPATQAFESRSSSTNLHERLVEFGTHVLATLLDPALVSWMRFISSELSRRQELFIYVHPLVDQHHQSVQDVLEKLIEENLWACDDVSRAAYFFTALITEPAKRYAYFAIPPGTKEEQHVYVSEAVSIFVSGARQP